MAKHCNKGTTLIELMISSVILSIIMFTVFSVWHAGNASARNCINMSHNTDTAYNIIDNIKKQLERLACIDGKDVPIQCSYSGSKFTITILTHKGLWQDDKYPLGPYIIQYIFDKSNSTIRYYQKPELNFAVPTANIKDCELLTKNVKKLDIMFYSDNTWKQLSNNKVSLDEIKLVKVELITNDGNQENEYSIIVHTH